MRIPDASPHRLGYFEVRPADVAQRSDVHFFDVRREEDLLGAHGHIHGVHHVPMPTVQKSALPVPPTTAVVLVCDNGRDSSQCAAFLVRDHGFREVYHLVGGMVRWVAEERPVARVRTYR